MVKRDDFSIQEGVKLKYKAIVTDLDGTAVDSPVVKVASRRLAEAVKTLDEHGVKVCAATGRAQTFAYIMFKSMNLHDPAIVSGGAKIIDPVSGKDLWVCGLDSTKMHQIINNVSDLDYGFLWNDSTEEDYLGGGWGLDKFSDFNSTYFFVICFVPNDDVYKVTELLKQIEGIAVTVVISHKPNMKDIHITNSKATKEHAIYELEKMMGFDKSEMIGIGDGYNDIHLYNAVGYRVAMGNAVDELKDVADIIIGDVKEDGLAIFFEELISKIEGGEDL